ncbi:phosphonate transport system permease protein [Evansella caseinilytica]|uniref:Phosphonate transport system permease protein n=1 Tax=Evansella caseinilytica TaxID=1503961 RepID=A0A1H3P0H4_9BACI|nr:phosphonate ABC transporter, permease protein PhnE [Evansella caseinilytica]SDY94295.1 phosphonate transport system permease protein [Evansella caseinilytica]
MKPSLDIRTIKNPKRMKYWWTFVGITIFMTLLYYVAFTQTNLSTRNSIWDAGPLLKRFFWDPFFMPEIHDKIPTYIHAMLETVAIAYAGTLIGAVLAIPVGFLAAANIGGHFSFIGKGILNAVRAFPEILFAIIFVASVGMGPYAGVLAIGINSIGMLGKLYAEVIESIDMEIIHTLKATGASKIQIWVFGVIPQVIPEFCSYALYRYEIDVRSSTVLGIVGAGGVGAPLILAANSRKWEEVGMMLVVIILTVTIIDLISTNIRKRIV